jgi:hypothetical protein
MSPYSFGRWLYIIPGLTFSASGWGLRLVRCPAGRGVRYEFGSIYWWRWPGEAFDGDDE